MKTEQWEKRDFVRVPLQTAVEVRAGGKIYRPESGLNISMNGLAFETNEPAPVMGSACTVSIILEASAAHITIGAAGTVVRAKPGNLAVELTSLDPDSYGHLRRLILYNAEDPARADLEFAAHWGIRRPPP